MYITRIYDVSDSGNDNILDERREHDRNDKGNVYDVSVVARRGMASKSFGSQAQFEFIYGLGYIDENQSYYSSTGAYTHIHGRCQALHTVSDLRAVRQWSFRTNRANVGGELPLSCIQ